VNRTVTIRPKAKADLRRAHDWYEERCAGLGDEFLADHAEALLRLEADPDDSRFIIVVFAASLPTGFPTKSFSASSGGTSSSFAFCTARKIIRANFAGKTPLLQGFRNWLGALICKCNHVVKLT
jgi:hypothetical protein